MIARPVNRPRPIPFAAPAPGAHAPRPVSWAASSGPAPQALASAPRPQLAMAHPAAANETVRQKPLAPPSVPAPARRQAPAGAAPGRTSGAPKATPELSARYVGHGALSVRSSVTGRHYRFQGHGDCQKIDKHDMLMLKRIPDLIVS
ncbi:MAG TPA: hypothetical protein VFW93_10655 [Aquabacterium sp.]|uniref:hypothetical protein n=1 Tax=Aquabacterium sp. TaxID=1872578 RepID=UPI002E36D967|nr:hypothetical protein [Aquabacterium sp.]HEX5356670.1 hypothetical protein [Aquabacterium sp.]